MVGPKQISGQLTTGQLSACWTQTAQTHSVATFDMSSLSLALVVHAWITETRVLSMEKEEITAQSESQTECKSERV